MASTSTSTSISLKKKKRNPKLSSDTPQDSVPAPVVAKKSVRRKRWQKVLAYFYVYWLASCFKAFWKREGPRAVSFLKKCFNRFRLCLEPYSACPFCAFLYKIDVHYASVGSYACTTFFFVVSLIGRLMVGSVKGAFRVIHPYIGPTAEFTDTRFVSPVVNFTQKAEEAVLDQLDFEIAPVLNDITQHVVQIFSTYFIIAFIWAGYLCEYRIVANLIWLLAELWGMIFPHLRLLTVWVNRQATKARITYVDPCWGSIKEKTKAKWVTMSAWMDSGSTVPVNTEQTEPDGRSESNTENTSSSGLSADVNEASVENGSGQRQFSDKLPRSKSITVGLFVPLLKAVVSRSSSKRQLQTCTCSDETTSDARSSPSPPEVVPLRVSVSETSLSHTGTKSAVQQVTRPANIRLSRSSSQVLQRSSSVREKKETPAPQDPLSDTVQAVTRPANLPLSGNSSQVLQRSFSVQEQRDTTALQEPLSEWTVINPLSCAETCNAAQPATSSTGLSLDPNTSFRRTASVRQSSNTTAQAPLADLTDTTVVAPAEENKGSKGKKSSSSHKGDAKKKIIRFIKAKLNFSSKKNP